MKMSYPQVARVHTVVIGSGLAGLSCARKLAMCGKDVCVIEKASELGGHLLPFERAGVTFEVGLHYIADTQAGSPFAKACESLKIQPRIVALDQDFEELRFTGSPGEAFHIRAPLSEFIANLKKRFPMHATSLDRYYDTLETLWQFARGLDFPLRTRDIFGAVARQKKWPTLLTLATQSVEHFFKKSLGISGELYEALVAQHLLVGVSPDRLSAFVYLLVHRYYFENPCFIEGGGRALIEALKHSEVSYFKAVQDIRIERVDGRPGSSSARFGVQAGGQLIYADNVIWTPDPRTLAGACAFGLGRLTDYRLKKAQNPHALVVGYFATRKSLSDYGFENRNYWLMGELSSEQAYGRHDPEDLARAAPLYLSMGSLRDPLAVSPENKLNALGAFQAMFLMPGEPDLWDVSDADKYRVPESRGGFGRAYRLKKERVLSLLRARLEKEFPCLVGDLLWEELGTPLTHGRFLNSVSRNGYGFAATVFDALIGRPSYATGIEGLYFCGSHIKPAHGIVTALLSGVGLAEKLST